MKEIIFPVEYINLFLFFCVLSYTIVSPRKLPYCHILGFSKKYVSEKILLFFLEIINGGRYMKYVCVSYEFFCYTDILKYSTLAFRLLKLKEMFNSKFGSSPKFYVRAPGRVNIIGIAKVPSLIFFFLW